MHRRSFIELLARLSGVGVLAPRVRAEPAGVELQRSPVAGFQYHEGAKVWPRLRPGDALDLVRESENPYDGRAVRLEWRGRKLGYVPRLDNAAVSHLLDDGRALRAEIIALRESANPWQRIEFAVYLDA